MQLSKDGLRVTFGWLAWWAALLVVVIEWLATLVFAIFGFLLYYHTNRLVFLVGCAFVLVSLGVIFVTNVKKFYIWWYEQRLNLKEHDAHKS